MSLFDDKEEVLEIELTQHGKRKLAEGKLDVEYYSFSDEDVIYDSEYAGISESVSRAHDRIYNNTAYLKPTYNFETIEKDRNFESPINTMEEYLSIGTSDLQNQYYPSWDITSWSTEISSSTQFLSSSNGKQDIPIPQLNMGTKTFNLNIINSLPRNLIDQINNYGISTNLLQESDELIDDGVVEIENNYMLFEVNEKNSIVQNDNFEFEIFLVEQDSDGSEELRKLEFATQQAKRDNNIYQPPTDSLERDIKPKHVEYYFDVDFDKNIQDSIACEYIPKTARKSPLNKDVECVKDFERVLDIIYDDEADFNENCDNE